MPKNNKEKREKKFCYYIMFILPILYIISVIILLIKVNIYIKIAYIIFFNALNIMVFKKEKLSPKVICEMVFGINFVIMLAVIPIALIF